MCGDQEPQHCTRREKRAGGAEWGEQKWKNGKREHKRNRVTGSWRGVERGEVGGEKETEAEGGRGERISSARWYMRNESRQVRGRQRSVAARSPTSRWDA